jgi:predicted DNA-binding transcriptional regulator AlpA
METDRLIPLAEVGQMLSGISEKSVRRLIASGELPQPLKVLSVSTLAESDVVAYIERLKAKRRGDK